MSNPRKRLKWELIDDPKRRVYTSWGIHVCEAQGYRQHTCKGGVEMNESIFNRNKFKHLPKSKQGYFWHRINCNLICTWAHRQFGETKAFRIFWRQRAEQLYGTDEVQAWIDGAPLRIK